MGKDWVKLLLLLLIYILYILIWVKIGEARTQNLLYLF